MSEFKRQTEQTHNIDLPSKIVICHWRKNIASDGEKVNYDILTEFISDNTIIQIKINDNDGKEVFSTEKAIKKNTLSNSFEIPESNAKNLVISVAIPDYGLQATSKPLKLVQSPKISDLKWSEEQITLKLPEKSDSDKKDDSKNIEVTLSAKTENIPNKSLTHIVIATDESLKEENTITTIPVKVENNSITTEWEFNKETIRPHLPKSEHEPPFDTDKNTFASLFFGVTYKSQQQVSPELKVEQELTYIKFKLFDDIKDTPLENIIFDITLPDGTKHPAKSDASGEVEVKFVEPGVCSIKSDISDRTLKDTFRYIGLGTQALQEKEKEEKDNKNKKSANKEQKKSEGPKTIAFIETYKVETGDTLESIAESFELTKDALTNFNWNTTDQEEINKCLYKYVGSNFLDKDDNLVLRSKDTPGILFIPRKLVLNDFKTNDFYTLRLSLIEEKADLIIPVPMNLDGDSEIKDELRITSEDGSFEKIIKEDDKENVTEDTENELLFLNFGTLPDGKYRIHYKVGEEWYDLIAELTIKDSDPYIGETPFLANASDLIKQEFDEDEFDEDEFDEDELDEDELDEDELDEDELDEDELDEDELDEDELDEDELDEDNFDEDDFDEDELDEDNFPLN